MRIDMIGGSVIIEGKTYTGKNIQFADGQIFVDGKAMGPSPEVECHIVINGDVESLLVDRGSIHAHGRVGTARTISGDLRCGDVGGDVRSISGAVHCGKVAGDVSTVSGNIKRSLSVD